jgi:hypothetical protein
LYRQSSKRAEKSRILDEISRNLGVHRKSAIRLLNHKEAPRLKRAVAPRASKIPEDVRKAIAQLWHRMGRMGSLAMHAALPEWLLFDAELARTLQLEILKVSARTIERIIKVERAKWKRKSNTGTKRAKRPQTLVPLRALGAKITEVGHIEIDTVAHCGDSMSGTFAWTVTATDILSNWTDVCTVWSKDATAVCMALQIMEKRSPIRWKSIYADNGSEFINEIVVNYFTKTNGKRAVIPVFRCRPYRKNDQAHVEQKNWTHVRLLWGYMRVNYEPAVSLMNSVAEKIWLPLQNGFVPQRKVVSKIREGSKVKKTFDKAQTPYERLLARPENEVSLEEKQRIIQWKEAMNPFELRKKLSKRTYPIFRLLDATKEQPVKNCA